MFRGFAGNEANCEALGGESCGALLRSMADYCHDGKKDARR